MTYYDHATAITCKLGQWSEERAPRSFESELISDKCRTKTTASQKQTLLKRCLAFFTSRNTQCSEANIRIRKSAIERVRYTVKVTISNEGTHTSAQPRGFFK